MKLELPKWGSVDARQLRRFGLELGGLLVVLALGTIAAHRGLSPGARTPALLGVGIALAVLGWLAPPALRAPWWAWTALGAVLGAVTTRVVLTLAFFFVVTPVGVLLRLRGWDLLDSQGTRASYWVARSTASPDHFVRQFSMAQVAGPLRPHLLRRWAGTVAGVAIGAAIVLGTGEIALRTWEHLRYGEPLLGPMEHVPLVLDEALGWRPREGFRLAGERRAADGAPYFADARQDARGFKAFGDRASRRPRVLVIGDSFTQAVDVSNEDTWYSIAARELGWELFAYGGGGYGTLQELLVMERYVDEVKPDLVVLQFSTNDFVDNSLELERVGVSPGMRRPYWGHGRIEHAWPVRGAALRDFAQRHCRLLYIAITQLDRFLFRFATADEEIVRQGIRSARFARSLEVTGELLVRFRERAKAPVVSFMVGPPQLDGRHFLGLCESARITCSDELRNRIATVAARGSSPFASDGAHWNPTGHLEAAQALIPWLRSLGYDGTHWDHTTAANAHP